MTWMKVALGASVALAAILAASYALDLLPAWTRAMGYVQAQQEALYRILGNAVRSLKQEGSLAALGVLCGLSFLYGVFHAVGPGHGKAVIGAYMMATGETIRRGIVLSLISALAQGLTAIVIVGVLVLVIGMTARAATENVAILETMSFLMIAGLGAWLIVRELRAEVRARSAAHNHDHGHNHHHDHDHRHDHHHDHDHHKPHAHGHDHDHVHDANCGHDHALEARVAAQGFTWTGILSVIGAVGLRPCMGAILVLVFTLGQELFAAGLAAVLAMSLGTGLTVAAMATMAGAARGPLVRAILGESPWLAIAHRSLSLTGGILLLAMGISLALAPATSPLGPFPGT